jgi:hypothetical protein
MTREAFFTQSRMQLRWICPCHLINAFNNLRNKVSCNKESIIHIGKKNQLIIVAKLNMASEQIIEFHLWCHDPASDIVLMPPCTELPGHYLKSSQVISG